MTDIVERLRADARLLRGDRVTPDCFPDLMDEAADLISELVGALEEAHRIALIVRGGIEDAQCRRTASESCEALLGHLSTVVAKARGGAA